MRGAYVDMSVRGLAERFLHAAEDVQAALARLVERVAHDLAGDAADLDVHLHRGDPIGGPGDLEVHVAEMVLVAEDVGEDADLVALADETHGDARQPAP